MKPSQPHHSATSLHRVPAGLRSLDLLIERVNVFADSHPGKILEILVVNDEAGQYAMPLSLIGSNVTCLHRSEISAQNTQSLANELGLNVFCKTTILDEEPPQKYDIIINPQAPATKPDLDDFLNSAKAKIKKHGAILAILSKSMPSQGAKQAGLRVYYKAAAGKFFPNIYKKARKSIKPGTLLFNTLDWADATLCAVFNFKKAVKVLEFRNASAPKLAVFILPTLFAGGGAERLVMELAKRIPEHGYEAHIIANVTGGDLRNLLIHHNIAHTIFERRHLFSRVANIFKVKNLLVNLKPDIIHTNLFAADFWGRVSARLSGAKHVVTTIHNVKVDFGFIGITVMRILRGYSEKYIAISDSVAEFIKEKLLITPAKIVTIKNGVDLAKIEKRKNRPFQDIPKILFVGRLERQKNPDILLKALAEIHSGWELHIYGQGSMERELKYLADELGILPRVHWMGITDDLNTVYANHDLFILPSAWEGFGLVAMEAAAAGLPMVVSDLPVMREIFGGDVSYAEPGKPESLVKAVQDVLDDPGKAVSKAQQLMARDFSQYSLETMAKKHAELYNSLIESSYEDTPNK